MSKPNVFFDRPLAGHGKSEHPANFILIDRIGTFSQLRSMRSKYRSQSKIKPQLWLIVKALPDAALQIIEGSGRDNGSARQAGCRPKSVGPGGIVLDYEIHESADFW
jgi:hypothetical protein